MYLIVVDHPDCVVVFIDEKFGPPPATPLPVYGVDAVHLPIEAIDQDGTNVLPKLSAPDHDYLAPKELSRYQGLTVQQDLVLTPPAAFNQNHGVLYLKGWIFPTDASINVALTQSDAFKPMPPRVQVKDADGNWQTVIKNMGFPMGKNKMVRVDLRGKFLSQSRQVRIQTNMQIYWDHAFFANELPALVAQRTTLAPVHAQLQYRGFSRMYRESPHGPHLFDYSEVSTDPKWRDLEGQYTRYGDVLPLLQDTDDQYIIMNAGDEIDIAFDIPEAPLKEGWTRDFILYSNGWLKDGDLNTAEGNTVAPLPFAGMSAYPYGSREAYPMSVANRAYMATYNTRVVERSAFQDVLKP